MNKQLSTVAAFGLLGVAASSQAGFIDFNSLSEGTVVSNQFADVTFSAGTGGLTVPFAGSGSGGWATNTNMQVTSTDLGFGVAAPMGGMILHTFDGWNDENNDPIFLMTFSGEVTDLSLNFGGVTNPGDSRILAFKTGSTTADYTAAAVSNGTSLVSLAGMTGVTKIIVTPGNFNDWVGVDNINFTLAPPVPEPASMAALGLGVAALLRRKRK